MNSLSNINKNRGNSAIELTRFILLFFLLVTHIQTFGYGSVYRFQDLRIFQTISCVSVDAFAIITGMFAFKSESQMKKNISRIIYVIIFSIILGILPIYFATGSLPDMNYILTGSISSWYLYAILIIYFIGPLIHKWMDRQQAKTIAIIGLLMFASIWAGEYSNFNGLSVGAIFGGYNFIILLPMSFFGYSIKRAIMTRKLFSFYLLLVIFGIAGKVVLTLLIDYETVGDNHRLSAIISGHVSPFTASMAVGIIGMISKCEWYSKKINWFVSHTYFIYEYHWIVFIVLRVILKDQLLENEHLWLYLGMFITLGILLPITFTLTYIQKKWWIPFSYKTIDKITLKLVKKYKIKN